jgi:hypothetical protein
MRSRKRAATALPALARLASHYGGTSDANFGNGTAANVHRFPALSGSILSVFFPYVSYFRPQSSDKRLKLLASPTGFEPVLPP